MALHESRAQGRQEFFEKYVFCYLKYFLLYSEKVSFRLVHMLTW